MSLCKNCHGSGKSAYINTTTWDKRPNKASKRYAMTWDVCDSCWGSGDELAPGPNLLEAKMRDEKDATDGV